MKRECFFCKNEITDNFLIIDTLCSGTNTQSSQYETYYERGTRRTTTTTYRWPKTYYAGICEECADKVVKHNISLLNMKIHLLNEEIDKFRILSNFDPSVIKLVSLSVSGLSFYLFLMTNAIYFILISILFGGVFAAWLKSDRLKEFRKYLVTFRDSLKDYSNELTVQSIFDSYIRTMEFKDSCRADELIIKKGLLNIQDHQIISKIGGINAIPGFLEIQGFEVRNSEVIFDRKVINIGFFKKDNFSSALNGSHFLAAEQNLKNVPDIPISFPIYPQILDNEDLSYIKKNRIRLFNYYGIYNNLGINEIKESFDPTRREGYTVINPGRVEGEVRFR